MEKALGHVGADQPTAPLHGGPVGDAASEESLRRLRDELASLRSVKAGLVHLKRAAAFVMERRFDRARSAAQKAIEIDPDQVLGWHLLGIAHEQLDDWPAALDAYERGLALDPAHPPIVGDLGRLAYRMGMLSQAETLFRHYLVHRPFAAETSNNLACVLRDQMRYQDAIDVLKATLQANPESAMLWNTLGTVMGDMGETEQAFIFYSEAVRLEPEHGKALYNLANTLFERGERQEAIDLCQRAIATTDDPKHNATMRLALAMMLLASGDLEAGWDAYRARLDPEFHDPIHFLQKRERWTPGVPLEGRSLFLIGEQGLGDEVLFANVLDDVLHALGPEGRLTLAVTDRLVPLFERAFPQVRVGSHLTIKHRGYSVRGTPFLRDEEEGVELWAPLGEPLREFRKTIADFPDRPQGFMKAGPVRTAHWRDVLSDRPGLKVGLLWTSLVIDSSRQRYFAPFDSWRPVLETPGISFVNLQYGDCGPALQRARDQFGVDIFQPPGVDLKMQLDEVAALTGALDLVIGVSNASFNIAAACGVPAWLITSHDAWTKLGTDAYPWYSQVRVFATRDFSDWTPLMTQIAAALGDWAAAGTPVAAAG